MKLYRRFVFVLVVLLALLLLAAPAFAQGGGENPIPSPDTIPALVSEIVNKLIVLAVTALAAALPLLWQRARLWAERQYAQLPANIRDSLEDAALVAARFVEQAGISEQLRGYALSTAEAKMDMAVNYGMTLLKAQGYRVDDSTQAALQGLIENVILAGQHKKEAAQADALVSAEAEPVLMEATAEPGIQTVVPGVVYQG
jgi:hypothetical protein